MLVWEENGHECELRLVLNGGAWEPKGRTVIARDIVAALEANPDMRREVMSQLNTPKPTPETIDARGLFRRQTFTACLRKDSDNPVRFSGSFPLRGAHAEVIYWPAQERSHWRIVLPCPAPNLVLESEGSGFQQAVEGLEEKLTALHIWATEIAVETSAAEQQQKCA